MPCRPRCTASRGSHPRFVASARGHFGGLGPARWRRQGSVSLRIAWDRLGFWAVRRTSGGCGPLVRPRCSASRRGHPLTQSPLRETISGGSGAARRRRRGWSRAPVARDSPGKECLGRDSHTLPPEVHGLCGRRSRMERSSQRPLRRARFSLTEAAWRWSRTALRDHLGGVTRSCLGWNGRSSIRGARLLWGIVTGVRPSPSPRGRLRRAGQLGLGPPEARRW